MYNEKSNRCKDRIVSIHQPHVRPIVRGKQGKKVEFGSKLGLSLANGFVKAGTLSWVAYNESKDLIKHTEAYKELKWLILITTNVPVISGGRAFARLPSFSLVIIG